MNCKFDLIDLGPPLDHPRLFNLCTTLVISVLLFPYILWMDFKKTKIVTYMLTVIIILLGLFIVATFSVQLGVMPQNVVDKKFCLSGTTDPVYETETQSISMALF